MASENRSYDVKINVIFPRLTKPLNKKDSTRVLATGAFNFQSRPQVDTTRGQISKGNFEKEPSNQEKIDRLKNKFQSMIEDFERIEEVLAKRSSHITLKYDPEIAENEPLTDAEETLFGVASGEITYEKFKTVLEYEEKINKYISHQSIENEGAFSASA